MTANQISYASLMENRRHNIVGETETNRTNVANEEIKRSDIAQRAYDNSQNRKLEQQKIDNAVRQTDIHSWDTGYDYMGPDGSVLSKYLGGLGAASSKAKPFVDILKTAYTMLN